MMPPEPSAASGAAPARRSRLLTLALAFLTLEVIAVAVGDKVNHTSFGNGVVLGVEGAGDKTVAKVKFDVGEKRLLLRYAPLTKLDA